MTSKILSTLGELLLCSLTAAGPLLFLAITLLCNLYLLIKPILVSIIFWSSYESCFVQARLEVAKYWIWHGRFFHAQRIIGLENVPLKGPAILVYYHGPIPVDYAFLVSTLLIERGVIMRSVVDKYFIWLPGLEMIVKAFGFHASSRAGCDKLLRKGHLIGVAPGGGYEAQLGTSDYKLMWKNRIGFAAIAVEGGNVPIIPVFTENIREVFVNLQCSLGFFNWFFKWTKAPMVPLYGGFPVRLQTYIGKPVYPDQYTDLESLRQATVSAMEDLIHRHQKQIPGSILQSVKDRMDLIENPFIRHYDFVVTKVVNGWQKIIKT